MRKSFTGVTFAPGVGVEVWSRGKRQAKPQREVGPRHLYESGQLFTLCGRGTRDYDRGPWWFGSGTDTNDEGVTVVGAAVHVSKARKTDCTECRRVYRARLGHRREWSEACKKKQEPPSTDVRDTINAPWRDR